MGMAWGSQERHLLKRVDLVGPWELHCGSSPKEYDGGRGPLTCYWNGSRASCISIQEPNKHLLWQTKHSERTAYVLSRLSWGIAHVWVHSHLGRSQAAATCKNQSLSDSLKVVSPSIAGFTMQTTWLPASPPQTSETRAPRRQHQKPQGLHLISLLKLPLPPHHQMLSYPLASHSSDLSQLL